MASQLLNPCGIVDHADAALAPRATVDGKTVVGLFSNQKANADAFLENVRDLLSARYDGIEFEWFGKTASVPAVFTHEFLNRCHVVAAAFAD
jgi:hypothetical protein